MADNRVRKIAIAGALSAIVIVLGLTRLGFIVLPTVSLTILHVPVIIGAILEGPLVGLLIGFLFGLFSLIQSAIAATGAGDIAFVNPLISVLPRLFIGPAAWLLYTLVSGQKFKGEPEYAPRIYREIPAIVIAALIGSLVNTILVLSALSFFGFLPWDARLEFLPELPAPVAVAIANGPVEAAVAAVITLAVVSAWKHIPRGGGKSRLTRESK
jgi:uncharacterized membrane protein